MVRYSRRGRDPRFTALLLAVTLLLQVLAPGVTAAGTTGLVAVAEGSGGTQVQPQPQPQPPSQSRPPDPARVAPLTSGPATVADAAYTEEEVVIPVEFEDGSAGPVAPEPAGRVRSREIIVRYKDGASGAMAAQALGSAGVRVAGPAGRDGAQLLRVMPDADVSATLVRLRADPRVAWAEPNYELRAQTEPNDPLYGQQWGMGVVAAAWAWEEALYVLPGGGEEPGDIAGAAPVTVAVVDTGADATHEDLAGRVLAGRNTITGAADPTDALDDSFNGHGTHVAGIAAAVYDNGRGIAGVAGGFPVSILPVKTLDAAGVGTMYDVAQAIRWAADWRGPDGVRVRVINLSLGARLPDYPLTLAEAVRYAQDGGVLVVAAAGNDGCYIFDDCGGTFYPAALPGVLAVGATGRDDLPASFSNRGYSVAAPGVDIVSTLPGNAPGSPPGPGNRYGNLTGTSMAAPFAAGAAALMWSAYPDKTAAEVAEALEMGRPCLRWDWNWWRGTYCAEWRNAFSAYQALRELAGGRAPYDWLEIIQPEDDARVAGTVHLTARAGNPANVVRVEFNLFDADGNQTTLGTVYGPASGLPEGEANAAGLFTLAWDTTAVADGRYGIEALLYTAGSDEWYYESAWIGLLVANGQASGLSIEVRKPGGSVAAGAAVTVYHAVYADGGYVDYEEIWDGNADLQGRVSIPGAVATDGNEYLVVARGTEPNFLYHRLVRAPTLGLTLDAADTQRLTVSGRQTGGQPLAGALLMVDLLEANLPEPADPGHIILHAPVAQLNAAGTAEVTLTRGHYNLRLMSAADLHYMVERDVAVTGDTERVEIHPDADRVATLRLEPGAGYTSAALFLRDEGDALGFELPRLDGQVAVTVTPGSYRAVIEAVYPDPAAGREWRWGSGPLSFDLAAGESRALPFGGPLSAGLSLPSWYDQNFSSLAFFDTTFPDAHGNPTAGLGWRPYSGATSAGSAGGSGGDILMRPAPVRQDATAAPDGALPPVSPAEPRSAPVLAYDPASGRFEPVAQSWSNVWPILEVRDGADQVVTSHGIWTLDFAYWWIPSTQTHGPYQARLKVCAGPLGPADAACPFGSPAAAGLVESDPLAFEVGPAAPESPASAPLTVTVLDRTGAPMSGARVALLRKTSDSGYEQLGDGATSDAGGVARFYAGIDPERGHALAVYGQSPVPEQAGVTEPVFLFVPFTAGTSPQTVTVDASAYTMRRLVVQARDRADAVLTPSYTYFEAYGHDAGGAGGGMRVEGGWSAAAQGWILWVAEGRHTFRAYRYRGLGGEALAEQSSGDLYHLVRRLDVPDDVPEDGVIVLGGAGNVARLEVQGPPTDGGTASDYRVRSMALFSQDLPGSPVFSGYGSTYPPIHVSPGDYRAVILLTRQHHDGDWYYWLERQVSAGAGETVAWRVYGSFTTLLDLAAPGPFGPGDEVVTGHQVGDAAGNRLVAVSTSTFWGSDHGRIAPFLVIRGPDGREVHRHRDAGPDDLDAWRYWNYDDAPIPPPSGASTFFGGRWTVPPDADGGQHTAFLDLGAGPGGMIRSPEVTFEISAALMATPRLDPLPAATNATAVTVRGATLPGAEVTVRYRFNEGAPVEAGTATAGGDGRFSLTVSLPAEGSYAFNASATYDGQTSRESVPVIVVVDRTPPGPPVNLNGEGQDQASILLTWEASPDSDAVAYRIYRDGAAAGQVAADGDLRFIDTGLAADTAYGYEVVAVDRAGNSSPPAQTSGRTLTGDFTPPSPPAWLAATARPGGLADLTWGAALDNIGVTGYHVRRGAGSQPETMAVIAVVYDANIRTFRDTGLPAETSYTYTVTAFDAAGNESAPSAPAAATTPPLGLASISWQAPLGSHGLLLSGSEVRVWLRGEPNRQAVAEVIYETAFGQVSFTLELAGQARTPGAYLGRFTLAPGTSGLTAVTGALSDGAGHTIRQEAAGLPLAVGGALVVTVLVPEGTPTDALSGVRLEAWSGSGDGRAGAILGNVPAAHTLGGLPAADDYRLRLLDRRGRVMAELTGIAVAAGRETAVSLSPLMPSRLLVRVTGPTGEGVPGVWVSLDEAGSGAHLGYWRSDAGGWLPVLPDLLEGDRIRLTLSGHAIPLPYRTADPVREVTLAVGANEETIPLEILSRGALGGRVTDMADRPLAGVIVTATQAVDGRSQTVSATTGEDGRYSLRLLAGPAQVRAADPGERFLMPQAASVTVDADPGTTTLDLRLDTLGTGTVTVAIYTREIGGEWVGPVEMDWRVAVHFGLRVTGARGGSYSGLPYPVRIQGVRPGETVRVCVDGREGGFPADCRTVELDEYRNAHASLRLEQAGRIRGRLVDADGNRFRELVRREGWSGKLYASPSTMDGGQWSEGGWSFIRHLWGPSDLADFTVPKPGRYRILFSKEMAASECRMSAYWGCAGFQRTAEVVVDVDQGDSIDLDDIRLLRPGFFRGGLEAESSEAAPGSTVAFRATYLMMGSDGFDPRLALEIPAAATLVPGSVTVNGLPAEATTSGSVYEVALGSLTGGTPGVVRYQLLLDGGLSAPAINAVARVRWRMPYQDGGSYELEELLGTARVRVAQVTLAAPRVLARPATTLSGRAPAGSTVEVFDGNVLLGETGASRNGYWRLDVVLPDRGTPAQYRLRARVETASGPLFSPEALSLYDPDRPQLAEVAMQQSDGRRISFDPSAGVVVFPYVFVPGWGFSFELRFNRPDLVYDVRVGIGNTEITTSPDVDGTFRAYTGGFTPGPLRVAYKTRPDPAIFRQPAPSETELRNRLPAWIRDFVVLSGAASMNAAATSTAAAAGASGSPAPAAAASAAGAPLRVTGADGACRQGPVTETVRFGLPQANNAPVAVSLTIQCGVSYSPSPGDLAVAGSAGVPVYGFYFDWAFPDGKLVINVGGYVPESAVDTADPGAAAASFLAAVLGGGAPAAGGDGKLGAASGAAMVRVGAAISTGLNMADLYDNVKSGFELMDKYEKLNHLLDRAGECSPITANMYRNILDNKNTALLAAEVTKGTLAVAGMLVGPATFGLGTLVIWGIGMAAGETIDAKIEADLDRLKVEIEANPECEKEEEEDDDDPYRPRRPRWPDKPRKVADPKWIYDPSGFVYEAVYANRVEGVTATALWSGGDESGGPTGPWSAWDAEWYEQENPQVTDAAGKYGWDVPEGWWKVAYEKEDYAPAESWVMYVPPPRTEVNVGMTSLTPPQVAAVTAVATAAGGTFIEVAFDRYMMASTLTGATVTVSVYGGSGEPLAGEVVAVGAEPDPNAGDVLLARVARFTPDVAFTPGEVYTVTVGQVVQNYAGWPMAADHVAGVTIPVADTTPPAIDNQSPAEGVFVNQTRPVVSATVTDSSGIDAAGITLYLDGVLLAHTFSAATGAITHLPATGLADGSHTVSLSVYDKAGNPAESSWSFTVDTVAPWLEVTTTPATVPAGGAVTITVTGDEALSAPPAVTVFVPGGEEAVAVTVTPAAGSAAGGATWAWTGSYTVPAGAADGSYVVGATGADLAGHAGRTGGSFTATGTPRGAGSGSSGGSSGSTAPQPPALPDIRPAPALPDIAGHWAGEAIRTLAELGVVAGRPDGNFDPERPVTRAELTKILLAVLGDGPEADPDLPFSDAAAVPEWARGWLATAYSVGLLRGYEDGTIRAGAAVTRGEMAVVLRRAFHLKGVNLGLTGVGVGFTDGAEMPVWALRPVLELTQAGILKGYPGGEFRPRTNSTRAEAAVLVLRAMKRMDLITATVKVSGMVRISEVEGRHFELESGAGDGAVRYVLVPVDGPGGEVARLLEGAIGREVQVTAMESGGADIYMRGPVLRVLGVR